MKETLENWPHNWYGFWKENQGLGGKNLPSVFEFVNANLVSGYDVQLFHYLKEGKTILSTGLNNFPDSFTNMVEFGAYSVMSDGLWVWPSVLIDYIVRHNVAIPKTFYEHIKNRNFDPSLNSDIEPTELSSILRATMYGPGFRLNKKAYNKLA